MIILRVATERTCLFTPTQRQQSAALKIIENQPFTGSDIVTRTTAEDHASFSIASSSSSSSYSSSAPWNSPLDSSSALSDVGHPSSGLSWLVVLSIVCLLCGALPCVFCWGRDGLSIVVLYVAWKFDAFPV